jgi:hypothetical protein
MTFAATILTPYPEMLSGPLGISLAAGALDSLAAGGAEVSEFSFDGGADQWRTDFLASALSGLVQLPLALFFVWGFHRIGLDRWFVLNGVLATILSVVCLGVFAEFVWNIYYFSEELLLMIGINRFEYMLLPNLSVCLIGALGFGWWLKRRHRDPDPAIFE